MFLHLTLHPTLHPTLRQRLRQALLSLLLTSSLLSAWAQTDPPGRVGRLANVVGAVSVFDQEQGQWSPALPNRPITSGDRVSTGPDARAEVRVGSTVVRLGARSELEATRIDDEALRFQLHSGSAAMRIRTRAAVDEVTMRTAEARFKPLRPGHYRFDRQDETSFAGSLSGELLVDESESFPIGAGQRMELWRVRGQTQIQHRWSALPGDALMAWVSAEDQRDDRTAANRYVSPEMTGAEDLDRYGRWDRHPEFGAIWIPLGVQVGWAPYRHGRWVALRPWGWTWVDEQPWGFAPFHYGRWLQWRGGWCWAPGVYVPRPVFSPALVTWIGGSHGGASFTFGGALPSSHWQPLPPRELYRPHYVASPRHVELVNEHGWHGGRQWRDERPERHDRPGNGNSNGHIDRQPRPESRDQRGGPSFAPVVTATQPIAQPIPRERQPAPPVAVLPSGPPQASGPWNGSHPPGARPPAASAAPTPERPSGKPGHGAQHNRDADRQPRSDEGKARAPEQRSGPREREREREVAR